MALWSDVIDPQELTGTVRADVQDYETNQNLLSRFLPNDYVDDTVIKYRSGGTGLRNIAQYRSYDAETVIGETPSGEERTQELPPLGEKVRVGEYDRLRASGRDTVENVRLTIEKAAILEGKAVADRAEDARGEALDYGKIVLNENGVKQTIDYGRDPSLAFTASTLLTDPTAPALDFLAAWVQQMIDLNGEPPAALLGSVRVQSALRNNNQLKNSRDSLRNASLSLDALQEVLDSEGLPPFYRYDKKVRKLGVTKSIIRTDRLVLLTAPVTTPDDTQLGRTAWGRTLESLEDDYNIDENDRPGIVVGAWRTRDPIGVWIHSAAISLPVLANPNLTMCVKVL